MARSVDSSSGAIAVLFFIKMAYNVIVNQLFCV